MFGFLLLTNLLTVELKDYKNYNTIKEKNASSSQAKLQNFIPIIFCSDIIWSLACFMLNPDYTYYTNEFWKPGLAFDSP